MSRYIDVDALHEKYDAYANRTIGGRGNGKTIAKFLDWIDEQPTADVVEVVHAYWYKAKNGNFWCSNCRSGYTSQPKLMGKPMFRYCPICGARMDERREDEQIH